MNYCVELSRLGYHGRKSKDYFCVNSNEAVGVEECAADAFCIDIKSTPS